MPDANGKSVMVLTNQRAQNLSVPLLGSLTMHPELIALNVRHVRRACVVAQALLSSALCQMVSPM